MLSELLFLFTRIFSLILRGNFLIIFFEGPTLSTKSFHEYRPRSLEVDKCTLQVI